MRLSWNEVHAHAAGCAGRWGNAKLHQALDGAIERLYSSERA